MSNKFIKHPLDVVSVGDVVDVRVLSVDKERKQYTTLHEEIKIKYFQTSFL